MATEKTLEKMKKSELLDSVETYKQKLDEKYDKLYKTKEAELVKKCNDTQIEKLKEFDGKYKEKEKEFDTKYDEANTKYNELYERLKREMQAGVTSLKLAQNFDARNKAYKKARWIKDAMLVALFIAIPVYWIFYVSPITYMTYKTFFENAPVFSFVIWAIIILLGRRAEDKKIEEIYNHKAAMAQTYVGFDELIKKLDNDTMGENDESLLREHIKNLLTAISDDPSRIVSVKRDKHPAEEVFNKACDVVLKQSNK